MCGDGIRILWNTAEQCDDNNTVAGDGCNATCQIEPGFVCSGGDISTSDTCTSICGDGKRVGKEVCDDGNTVSGDGCSGDCAHIEDGYTCAGGSSSSADSCTTCHASCGICSCPLPQTVQRPHLSSIHLRVRASRPAPQLANMRTRHRSVSHAILHGVQRTECYTVPELHCHRHILPLLRDMRCRVSFHWHLLGSAWIAGYVQCLSRVLETCNGATSSSCLSSQRLEQST